jgi:hypothetical protein
MWNCSRSHRVTLHLPISYAMYCRWVQNESLPTLYRMYSLTGDNRYLLMIHATLNWIRKYQTDHTFGEQYWVSLCHLFRSLNKRYPGYAKLLLLWLLVNIQWVCEYWTDHTFGEQYWVGEPSPFSQIA